MLSIKHVAYCSHVGQACDEVLELKVAAWCLGDATLGHSTEYVALQYAHHGTVACGIPIIFDRKPNTVVKQVNPGSRELRHATRNWLSI